MYEQFTIWQDRLNEMPLTVEIIYSVFEDMRTHYKEQGKLRKAYADYKTFYGKEPSDGFLFLFAGAFRQDMYIEKIDNRAFIKASMDKPYFLPDTYNFKRCSNLNTFQNDLRKHGFGRYAPYFAFLMANEEPVKIYNKIDCKMYDLKAIQQENIRFHKTLGKTQIMSKGIALSLDLTNTKGKPTARKRHLNLVLDDLTPSEKKAWEKYAEQLKRIEKRAKGNPIFTGIMFAFCTAYQRQWGKHDMTFRNPVIVEKSLFFLDVFGEHPSLRKQTECNKVLEEFQTFESNGVPEPFLRSVHEDGGRLLRLQINPLAIGNMYQYFTCPYHVLLQSIDNKGNTYKMACLRFLLFIALNFASTGKALSFSIEDLRKIMVPLKPESIGKDWIYKNIADIWTAFSQHTDIIQAIDTTRDGYRMWPNSKHFSIKAIKPPEPTLLDNLQD